MWNHPHVNKEWSKSGEKRGKVRFSHDAEERPYISRVELRVWLSNMDLQTICFVSSCADYISTRWMLSLLLYSAVLDPSIFSSSVMVANPLHWVSISQLRVHNISWPVDTERTSRQNSAIIWLVTLKYGRLLNILIKRTTATCSYVWHWINNDRLTESRFSRQLFVSYIIYAITMSSMSFLAFLKSVWKLA